MPGITVVAALIGAMAAGCDAGGEARPMQSSSEGTQPPLSSTDLPTMKPPTSGPSRPSDLVPADLIAGRITRGGSGPCYGLITEDGIEYAVHSTAGRDLPEGTYVRVKWAPLTLEVDCGPGRPVRAIAMTVLR